MNLLKVSELTKVYGKGKASTKAINELSLDVVKGEFIAVMGASGSGKSTLLNLISTIDRPTSGNIYINDVNITKLSNAQADNFRKEQLGFIFQDFRLMDSLTISENISVPLIIQKVSKKEIEKKVKMIMNMLSISELRNKYPYQVSGGEKQRAACARAIISEPQLILADEPTGALDSVNAHNIMSVLERINNELNATILMVTHDTMSACYCKKVILLKDGKIINVLEKRDKSFNEFHKEIVEKNSEMQQQAIKER